MIECRGLWKIFGSRASDAMTAIKRDGLTKKEIRERFDCVVGVQDASFSVSEGEIFCIMGLSGSGKSTLIRHVNRLIDPTAGRILIDGQDINALSQPALRKVRAERIGMVFQNNGLLPHRTVRDNVAFSLEIRGVDAAERERVALRAIDAVDLNGWDGKYPDELSGGMQQRVGLARAIAADPAILLMDEPFSALDPLIRRQLQDQFIALSAEMRKTTLFITHDLDEAIRLGNRIAIMKDGVIVQVGTPEEIVTEPADAYVADFVAGISKLNLISAGRIMEPLASFERREGPVGHASWPAAAPEQSLDDLIELAVSSRDPILIKAEGRAVGVVTKNALLRGIQGHAGAGGAEAWTGALDR